MFVIYLFAKNEHNTEWQIWVLRSRINRRNRINFLPATPTQYSISIFNRSHIRNHQKDIFLKVTFTSWKSGEQFAFEKRKILSKYCFSKCTFWVDYFNISGKIEIEIYGVICNKIPHFTKRNIFPHRCAVWNIAKCHPSTC